MNAPPDKPPLHLQPTTLWDYPSQHYGDNVQGDPDFRGATPSYIIWNLLQRYTRPGNTVLDPCCGSGTTLDVCRDTDRIGLCFDLKPTRDDIQQADARQLPVDDAVADFVFIDPPYSNHLDYSDDPRCIGKLSAAGGEYLRAMEMVIAEIDRVLKPDRHMALYVSDSYVHDPKPKTARQGPRLTERRGFFPLGFDLFSRLRRPFIPIDIVAVTRHNRTIEMGNYRQAAEEGNYFLRGFNYLFIMKKPALRKHEPAGNLKPAARGASKAQAPQRPSAGAPPSPARSPSAPAYPRKPHAAKPFGKTYAKPYAKPKPFGKPAGPRAAKRPDRNPSAPRPAKSGSAGPQPLNTPSRRFKKPGAPVRVGAQASDAPWAPRTTKPTKPTKPSAATGPTEPAAAQTPGAVTPAISRPVKPRSPEAVALKVIARSNRKAWQKARSTKAPAEPPAPPEPTTQPNP